MLRLDPIELAPFEIAARLHILLAYPRASEARTRSLVDSACADYVEAQIELVPDSREVWLDRYPQYMRSLQRGEKINIIDCTEWAQKMGLVVIMLVTETATGRVPIIGDQKITSLRKAAQMVWPRGQAETENLYEDNMHTLLRKIRHSYPVAHLCAALQNLAQERDAQLRVGSTNLGNDHRFFGYWDVDFLAEWVRRAGLFADLIRKADIQSKMPKVLIDVQWIGPLQLSAPSRGC